MNLKHALALLLALIVSIQGGWMLTGNGSAIAAARQLITGKQIRDRSIGLKDLAASARANDGAPGATGATGATGAPGERGAAGVSNVPGPAGATGAPGPGFVVTPLGVLRIDCPAGGYMLRREDQGPSAWVPLCHGERGSAGPAGHDGADGQDGAASTVPGPQGPKGDTGPQGPAGPQGPPGASGAAAMPWAKVAAGGAITAASSPDASSSFNGNSYIVNLGPPGVIACTANVTQAVARFATVSVSGLVTVTIFDMSGAPTAAAFVVVCVPE